MDVPFDDRAGNFSNGERAEVCYVDSEILGNSCFTQAERDVFDFCKTGGIYLYTNARPKVHPKTTGFVYAIRVPEWGEKIYVGST